MFLSSTAYGYYYNNVPVDGVNVIVEGGGGAWADCNSDTHIGGASSKGYRYAGTCLINCTTDNEIYSFHPGGTNVVLRRRLGSFRQGEHLARRSFALITRKAGEIISADQY